MSAVQALFADFWPSLLVLGLASAVLFAANRIARHSRQGTDGVLYQLLNWAIASAAVLVVVIVLPISDDTQGQILSLLGVVLTAVIALSSTTFVSNAMAGIMLKMTTPFRPGDYVRVNGEFGRVARHSLINTQIQTEWRDLTTLPNLYLVNNPVTVLHRDGTIISAEVSIGYDVPYTQVQKLLLLAVEEAQLSEPFVLVQELLDHAVVYRACGFLPEMKQLLTSRSNLRKKILEQLHGNGVEIVSPAFMNQRQLDPAARIIPQQPVMHDRQATTPHEPAPEEKIFDQAEAAAGVEELRQQRELARQAVKREKAHLKTVPEADRDRVERELERLELEEQRLAERLEQLENAEPR
ncbi:mechanosensitive ion channel family protein [Parahaliea maris]|uniref:Small-conductance mechanosensitive channel n=1 Tax=Parahaliea maris TaxID=2716870 RepID=A0A5C9A2G6_9GAMM|nr:mechanosensitive ion channel family protein [Parahaliea maris]TXS93960.1 mechanosensitive ion channel family protein [Parahaliea maris]